MSKLSLDKVSREILDAYDAAVRETDRIYEEKTGLPTRFWIHVRARHTIGFDEEMRSDGKPSPFLSHIYDVEVSPVNKTSKEEYDIALTFARFLAQKCENTEAYERGELIVNVQVPSRATLLFLELKAKMYHLFGIECLPSSVRTFFAKTTHPDTVSASVVSPDFSYEKWLKQAFPEKADAIKKAFGKDAKTVYEIFDALERESRLNKNFALIRFLESEKVYDLTRPPLKDAVLSGLRSEDKKKGKESVKDLIRIVAKEAAEADKNGYAPASGLPCFMRVSFLAIAVSSIAAFLVLPYFWGQQ